MASLRIVTVFGATGTQGQSIINALLADGTFTPRAITRNPDSETANALIARGAQVAKADLMDKESMVKAIRGSEAVFGLTNYFEPSIFPGNPTGEIEQGKNLIDAAKEAGVKFFVFSGLPSMSRISGGKYTRARHFDNKEVIEEYLKASGLVNATVHLGGFLENFWIFKMLKKTPTGFDIAVPKFTREALHNWSWVTRDVGPAVLALLKNYDDPTKAISGKVFPVVNSCVTYPELAEMCAKALGVPVTFTIKETSGIEELDEMFACQSEFASEFFKGVPVPNPELTALGVKFSIIEEFMEEVKTRFWEQGVGKA
ncbi:NmrA domain-containing protein [Mycena venus]|uniref:NmrA domain-containing protein n=1 Tax=Mycena venus TaxID=2733690 RepID=A0A8H6YUV8_9AGAR|nr:NmrA domain-containing protein [Mycena venus]